MAIRYVKDFEFPSAAGYTKSAPSKVTGQMYAKGGKVAPKAGKGIMVMIGVGKPMKKAEGSDQSEFSSDGYDRDRLNQMMGDIAATSEAERIMRKPTPTPKTTAPKAKKPERTSPYIPGTNIKPDPDYMRKLEENQSGGATPSGIGSAAEERLSPAYKKGGKVAKVMHEFKAGDLHSGSKKGPKVSNPKQAMAIAMSESGKMKKASGGMAQKVQMAKTNAIADSLKGQKKTPYAKGGMAKHDDVKEDKALIKSMVKGEALKKAAGGVAARGMFEGSRQTAPSMSSTMMKKKGGTVKKAMGGVATPLQSAALAPRMPNMMRAKAMPVAPAMPMVSAAPAPAMGVGVNAKRPGGPNVGAIRAAMAKRASQAMPENAPSAMKKGGKVKGC